MLRYIRNTFFRPRSPSWFGLGIIIESASAEVAAPVFARLREVLPYVNLDLLSEVERPGLGLRYTFRVKRALGGLRLLLHARKHYDLVVFFATGEKKLRLCRALALLVMRPQHFFVFNEFGEAFWLDRDNWATLRAHVIRRHALDARRLRWLARWKAWRDNEVAAARRIGRALRRYAGALRWCARLGPRAFWLVYAAVLFGFALALLSILRAVYDTRSFRFRISGKSTAAPRRELEPKAAAAAISQPQSEIRNPKSVVS